MTYTYSAFIQDSTLMWLKDHYGLKGTGFGTGETERTDLSDWNSQFKYDIGYNPFDAIDEYLPDLEKGPLGDFVNSPLTKDKTLAQIASTPNGYKTLTDYTLNEYDFFSYTSFENGTDREDTYFQIDDTSQYLKVVSDAGYVDPAAFYAGVQAGWSDTAERTVFQKLADEIEEMQHYTLTNQELVNITGEIEDIDQFIIPQLQSQISSLIDDYKQILKEYTDDPTPGIDIQGRAANNDEYIYDLDTLDEYDPNSAAQNDILFGTGDYTDSIFYKYFVALRSMGMDGEDFSVDIQTDDSEEDPDDMSTASFTFDDFLAQEFPTWNTKERIKDGGSHDDDFKASDYEGLEEGLSKLDMIDVFTNHYIFTEMSALFQQYEEAQNRKMSLQFSLEVASKYSLEFDYRKQLADEIWDGMSEANQDAAINDYLKIDALQRGNDYGPSGMSAISEYAPEFYGFYGNTSDPDDTTSTGYSTKNGGLVDPYEFTLNGVNYIMGSDKDGNGTIDDVSEILGINDVIDNPFESLVELDTNQDGFVSSNEMLAGNVVFNAVNSKGRMTNSTLDVGMIRGVDLSSLKKSSDTSGGLAGTFEIKTSSGKKIEAAQTFENQSYFNNLFGTIANLSPYQENAESENKTVSSYYSKLMQDLEGVYKNVSSGSNNTEATLEQICWETGTILTPAQKVRILDNIANNSSSESIDNIIRQEIQQLNLAA